MVVGKGWCGDGICDTRLKMPPAKKHLRIFRREAPVHVLGPGARAVIWVRGCPHACAGCIAPEGWGEAGGEQVAVDQLAHWVLAQDNIEGITLSGGEPFSQATVLHELIRLVQVECDLGVVCYTGYTYATLQAGLQPGWQDLLAAVDLLIDGPYIESQHANLLWRGSSNQRLIPLTARYQEAVGQLAADSDVGAGLELSVGPDGLNFTGIPP